MNEPRPRGLCWCGCGQPTRLARTTAARYGDVQGQPQRYLPNHHKRLPWPARFWDKVDRSGGPDACWPWTAVRRGNGYGAVTIDGRPRGAHRVSWELAHGPIAEGMMVCHRCDNPPCVNPAHLFLAGSRGNSLDAFAKGRRRSPRAPSPGERNGGAKLTAVQVAAIRERYAAGGVTIRELARAFGIGKSQAANIVSGKNWTHVDHSLRSPRERTTLLHTDALST